MHGDCMHPRLNKVYMCVCVCVCFVSMYSSSIVMSEDTTWRDQFYDGHPKKEKSEEYYVWNSRSIHIC